MSTAEIDDNTIAGATIAGTPVSLGSKPAATIELTDSASAKVAELLTQETQEGMALRIAVRPGGCSGYSYEMFFDADFAADDIVSEFGNGVKVVVDAASNDLIKGATLTYKDGLQDAGFHIENPNASRTCGCGSSFS